MSTQTLNLLTALHRAWNLARTAYYIDPSEANERIMDDALRAYLQAGGGKP